MNFECSNFHSKMLLTLIKHIFAEINSKNIGNNNKKNILEFNKRITKIIKNQSISCDNHENHENQQISFENNENHNNLRIPHENY